ncbi:MAG: hypothetical protein ACI95X_002221 [Paraglaciecola sp.]|jgi:hypothetical protein
MLILTIFYLNTYIVGSVFADHVLVDRTRSNDGLMQMYNQSPHQRLFALNNVWGNIPG